MQALAKSSRYAINMSDWHSLSILDSKLCGVCMAGALLTRNFKVPFKHFITFEDIEDTDRRLLAFDLLRKGFAVKALLQYEDMNTFDLNSNTVFNFSRELERPYYTRYEQSPKGFYKWCRQIADTCETRGH